MIGEPHPQPETKMAATAEVSTMPVVLHRLPGRLRVRVASLSEANAPLVRRSVAALGGVRAVEVRPLTGTVLVHFEAHHLSEEHLLAALAAPARNTGDKVAAAPATRDLPFAAPSRSFRLPSIHGSSALAWEPEPEPEASTPPPMPAPAPIHTGAGRRQAAAAGWLSTLWLWMRGMATRARERGPALLPYLPKLAGLGLAILSISSPWAAAVVGLESLQLFAELGEVFSA